MDAKTEEDVTRSCLVQIILEMDKGAHKPFFSQEILENILRFYNNPLHEVMKDLLERYLNLIASQQKHFCRQNMANWWEFWSNAACRRK